MQNCAAFIAEPHLPELSQVKIVGQAVSEDAKVISLPLYLGRISAGFPSPADDYLEAELDLNRYMIRNPPDTFMVRVTNDALAGAGILDGDVLIVDRSIGPRHGMIVVAVVNGEMCIRRLNRKSGGWVLDPENRDFQPLRIRPGQDLEIWGVVTGMVRKY
jgi:DNA polymerase V